MTVHSFYHDAADITWYCEQQGQGPTLVLIPSGEGDCANFAQTAQRLGQDFTVLTFDTPGFSRSSAPADAQALSLPGLSDQIAALLRSLDLGPVTVYGCSSGGRAVLDLVAHHADLVRNALVHEAALPSPAIGAMLGPLVQLDDAGITAMCQDLFANLMNEDAEAWQALGPDYHARLARNYVTWVRRYIAPGMGDPVDPAAIQSRPITWTIGALTERAVMQSNIDLAQAAGLDLGTLPCRHFPQVSIPDALAAHIKTATAPYLA